MASRNLDLARKGYSSQDIELCIAAHDDLVTHPQEDHAKGGDYVKSLVFGGLDGIVTTFAVVSAVAGASLSPKVVIIYGIANLVSDALAMGIGDYLSEKAEIGYAAEEHRRESWEMENYPEGEKREMLELYMSKGISGEDAEFVVNTLSKYKEFFVNHMMVVELGKLPPEHASDPAIHGLVTFGAFMLFGTVPLLSYICLFAVKFGQKSVNILFIISLFLTALTMYGLGVAKARLAKQPMIKAGFMMLFNGVIAASSAYLVGWALQEGLGLKTM